MIAENIFVSLYNSIVDLMFPNSCFLCEKLLPQQQVLCDECFAAHARLSSKKIGADLQLEVFSLFNYREPLEKLVHSKFTQNTRLLSCLGRLLWQCPGLKTTITESGVANWIIVPVPLHWRRLWSRGFNQANYLAAGLAKASGCSNAQILRRSKNTAPQTQTRNKTERLLNLKDAITLDTQPFFGSSLAQLKHQYKGCGIILVDDLLTSGATLLACAQALKALLPNEIIAITVCRG